MELAFIMLIVVAGAGAIVYAGLRSPAGGHGEGVTENAVSETRSENGATDAS